MPVDRRCLVAQLRAAGCVAAEEEADELLRAYGGGDPSSAAMAGALARRLGGEPLAWICGSAEVDGLRLHIEPGVYVPRRWQTPAVARLAAALLPPLGTAVDLCTGAGTIAALLRRVHPGARVVGTEIDPVAARCARRNGVEVVEGDLFDPLPSDLAGAIDVVTAVAPYVPTAALPLLPRDTLAHEPLVALDGGKGGLTVVHRIADGGRRWLRPGGWLVLELGPEQTDVVRDLLQAAGWRALSTIADPDGDACGVAARRP